MALKRALCSLFNLKLLWKSKQIWIQHVFILNTRLFFSHQSLFVALLSAQPFRRTAPLKHQTSCPYFSIFPNAVKRGRRKWHDCTGNNKLNIIDWFLLSWKNVKNCCFKLQVATILWLVVSARTAQVQSRPNTHSHHPSLAPSLILIQWAFLPF